MTAYVVIGVCLVLAVAWVGWTAGTLYELRRAERADLNARDRWVADYQRRNGVS